MDFIDSLITTKNSLIVTIKDIFINNNLKLKHNYTKFTKTHEDMSINLYNTIKGL